MLDHLSLSDVGIFAVLARCYGENRDAARRFGREFGGCEWRFT